jgi:hypothetical protein
VQQLKTDSANAISYKDLREILGPKTWSNTFCAH